MTKLQVVVVAYFRHKISTYEFYVRLIKNPTKD